jgi:anti-sigma-K factor RskA
MNDSLDHDLHEYLLNQMDAGRRAAFERELEGNAELRAALKASADTLAGFACAVAPADPLGAAEQQAVLQAIVAATERPAAGIVPFPAKRRAWRAGLWPAAAAILLLLNFIDFRRPLAPGAERRSIAVGPDKSTPGDGAPGENDPAGRERTAAGVAEKPTGPRGATPAANAAAVAALEREVERLRADKAELERTQERWRTQFERDVQVGVARVAAERDLNRLATMELVDPASFARGERRGLVSVGKGILTEPGLVVSPESPASPAGAAIASAGPPYAWSVFDEKEHRGYLNLYQLPQVPAEQSLQIWVRPADAKDFQRVGEVPSPAGGGNNSGVQYVLPAATGTPAEVLITIERRDALPAAPTGPTVLRGP